VTSAPTAAARRVAKAGVQLVNTARATGARGYRSPGFAADGYCIEPGFVDARAAAAILADVERFTDRAVTASGVDGVVLRDRAKRQQRDLNVRQLTHAEALSPTLGELLRSGRIERAFAGLTGRALRIGGITVQIDWPDTETKRGLHVDSHWPPTFKAFVYLTPVRSPANGPFCVVPGSHRHRVRKLRAIAGDYLTGRDHTDLDHEYSMDEAVPLLGEAGTSIFADQRLAHAGCPEHTTGTRVMAVAYLYDEGTRPPAFLGH